MLISEILIKKCYFFGLHQTVSYLNMSLATIKFQENEFFVLVDFLSEESLFHVVNNDNFMELSANKLIFEQFRGNLILFPKIILINSKNISMNFSYNEVKGNSISSLIESDTCYMNLTVLG